MEMYVFCTFMLTINVVPLGQFLPSKESVNGLKKSRRRYRVSVFINETQFYFSFKKGFVDVKGYLYHKLFYVLFREKLDILIDDEGKNLTDIWNRLPVLMCKELSKNRHISSKD